MPLSVSTPFAHAQGRTTAPASPHLYPEGRDPLRSAIVSDPVRHPLSSTAAVKNVPFDPIAMFDADVSGATDWTGDGACRDRTTDFCNRTSPPAAACL